MAYENIGLKELREMALVMNTGSDAQNRFGALMNRWLNEGLRRMWQLEGVDGVYDEWELTVAVGEQTCPLDRGFIKPRACFLRDGSGTPMTFTPSHLVRTYTTTRGRPNAYTVVGKPNPFLVVGPYPVDNAYEFTLQGYRTPRALLQDTDVPELPDQFMLAPAYFAGAQAAQADNNFEAFGIRMQIFEQNRAEFKKYLTGDGDVRFMPVTNQGDM